MEKILIVYESRYGATRQYAQAIGRALGFPVYPRKKLPAGQLESCSVLVYGGGLYAGGVAGIHTLKQAMERYPQKNFVLFTCGVADPALPETVATIRRGLEKALGAQALARLHLFCLRGRLDYSQLSPLHRMMMAALRRMLKRKDPRSLTEEDRQILDTYGSRVDFVNLGTLTPLLSCLEQL